MGTVSKLLQQALVEKSEKPQSLRQMPSELQHAFLVFVDQQAEDARSQIADDLMHCRREMADLAEDNELMSSTVEDLQRQLADSMSRTANVEGQVKMLASELATAREETAAERRKTEASQIELTRLQLRLEAMMPIEEELRRFRAQFDAQHGACMKLEQIIAVLEAQKDSLEQQHSGLRGEFAETQAVNKKLIDKVETITSSLDKERETRMLAERELAVASATYAKRRSFGHRASVGKRQT
jgi:chromosome segregation ATPase